MGKSYKHYPFCKCEKSCKKGKKWANRRVRAQSKEMIEIANGKSYKKLFNSWDICDYCDSFTWEEYKAWKKSWGYDEPDYLWWYKTYKRK